MNFTMSERQKHWRDRVMAFMDAHVYPAVETYDRQDEAGDRWKVIPVLEELKAKAKAEGLWNMFLPPSPEHDEGEFHGAGLDQSRIRALLPSKWAACPWRPKCSIARRPTPATWKCCIATARPSKRPSG